MDKKTKFWIIVSVICYSGMMIIIGFYFGFYTDDDKCLKDPLRYGIVQLDSYNNDNIICTCYSSKVNKPFVFDKDGIVIEETNSNHLLNNLPLT